MLRYYGFVAILMLSVSSLPHSTRQRREVRQWDDKKANNTNCDQNCNVTDRIDSDRNPQYKEDDRYDNSSYGKDNWGQLHDYARNDEDSEDYNDDKNDRRQIRNNFDRNNYDNRDDWFGKNKAFQQDDDDASRSDEDEDNDDSKDRSSDKRSCREPGDDSSDEDDDDSSEEKKYCRHAGCGRNNDCQGYGNNCRGRGDDSNCEISAETKQFVEFNKMDMVLKHIRNIFTGRVASK